MQTLWQDLRYGARMLLKQPSFILLAAPFHAQRGRVSKSQVVSNLFSNSSGHPPPRCFDLAEMCWTDKAGPDADRTALSINPLRRLLNWISVVNLLRRTTFIPLQFWEKAMPKADRLPFPLIIRFISNHVIQGFMRLAQGGTLLDYAIRMATENRRAWSQATI